MKTKRGRPVKEKSGYNVSIYITHRNEAIWEKIKAEADRKCIGVGQIICSIYEGQENERTKI